MHIDNLSSVVKDDLDADATAPTVAETERTDDAIDVEKLHTDGGLITASQVKSNDCPTEVLELGKRAATHLEKAAKCDDKAEQHRVTAGQYFAQARAICDDGGLEAFRERFFPHVARSRAYELLAIATNKKSIEANRTETRKRVAKHRARKAAALSSVTVTDNATGNGTDSEASAEARKRYYADAELDDIDQVEVRTDGAEKPADGENGEPTAVTTAGAENDEIKILAPKQPSLLDLWGEATPVQRRDYLERILDGVELEEFLAVCPLHLRRGLEGRLMRLHGLRRSEQLTKVLKKALRSRSPAEQITALDGINKALTADGLDFEAVQVRVPKSKS